MSLLILLVLGGVAVGAILYSFNEYLAGNMSFVFTAPTARMLRTRAEAGEPETAGARPARETRAPFPLLADARGSHRSVSLSSPSDPNGAELGSTHFIIAPIGPVGIRRGAR